MTQHATFSGPVRLRLSASQIDTFTKCQRKWAWRYIENVEEPPNEAAELGRDVHAQLETYLRGGALDFTRETGYIAAAGLEHLPKPGTPGLRIEEEFHFFGPSGHSYLGYKDLEAPGAVYDHKSTSSLKWQKTPEQLKTDVQAVLYATDYFRNHPEDPCVELRWVYYQTKNTKKSAVTSLVVLQDETWQRFLEIEKIAEEMAVASTSRALDLPPTIDHCSAYGGCPHQGRCNLSPLEKMRSHMSQNKLTALLKGKTNGAPPPSAPTSGGRPDLAFGPGGAHEAAAPTNKLLARMQAKGAPAPAAINPPEHQPPPAAPPPAPAAAAPAPAPAPAATPAAAAEAPRGRGRPSKAALPETGVVVKIKTLYINCAPVGLEIEDASTLVTLAKKTLEEGALADYRFAEFGQGPGMLLVAAMHQLDTLDGIVPAMRLDTTTPEGAILASDLMARAELVVR